MRAGGRTDWAMQAATAVLAAGVGMLTYAPTRTTAELGAAPAPHAAACDPGRFKIALDVGHTVEAPGATSARGVKEYVFNLRLAKNLAARLNDAGFAQTHVFVMRGIGRAQLVARATRANALGIDLLVSIHHDDVQDRHKSKWNHRGEIQLYSDKFSGHALFISRESPHDSLAFARLLGAELQARGLRHTTHHAEEIPETRRELLDPELGIYRYDELLVLKLTKAPAVLVEAGIIVNRTDELMLETPEHQTRITEAMLAAIKQFCGIQQSKPPPQRSYRSRGGAAVEWHTLACFIIIPFCASRIRVLTVHLPIS